MVTDVLAAGPAALAHGTVALEVAVPARMRQIRLDLMISWLAGDVRETVGVELMRLTDTRRFIDVLERLLGLSLRIILVVVGTERRLARIRDDIVHLERLGGNVRVITVIEQSERE